MFLKLHWSSWDFIISLQRVKHGIQASKAEVLPFRRYWKGMKGQCELSVGEKLLYQKIAHWTTHRLWGLSLHNILCYFTLLFHGFSRKPLKFLVCLWHWSTSSNTHMSQICGCLFPADELVNLILNHCTFPHKCKILCIWSIFKKLAFGRQLCRHSAFNFSYY